MSRFFHGSDSSSESSSEEESLYSDEEQEPKVEKAEASEEEDSEDEDDDDDDSSSDSSDEEGRTGVQRFLKYEHSEASSGDEDETPTVVRSAKDKKFEELEGTVRLIENAEKIGDWAVISSEYDKLNRQVPRLQKDNDGKTPKLYIKTVADLEVLVEEAVSKQKVTPKKMNALAVKGLNAMRQKIRKANREYQTEIDAYKNDKEGYMAEEEAQEIPVPTKKPRNREIPDGAQLEDGDDGPWEGVGRDGRALKYTAESILKHLRTIVEARGRKNTDRLEQIRVMERLLDVANTDYQRIRVLLSLISTRFDLTSGSGNYMSQEQWKLADGEFTTLLGILDDNPNIVILEGAEEWEDDEKQPQIDPKTTFKIPGSIVSFVERLDDELTRSLQHIDPHTAEYIERLSDESALYTNIVRGLLYVERLQNIPDVDSSQETINRVVIRRLEHVYFKPSQVVTILEETTWKAIPQSLNSTITPRGQNKDTASLVQTLCNYLFSNSEGIIRARAMLCQIYFLALHEEYYRARDMMLMSHLQETIAQFDVNTQILFNRTLVQVGLCAFRAGLVYEAQNTLQEICGSGRQKELLAQGVQMTRYSQVSPEQERLERQRQLPFHMHINLELLECVYLTCSMLLEIPLLAQTGSSPDIRKRIISKTYRRMLEYHERQIFTGPPENTRDHVMQASKALAAGEWRKAADFISAIKIWDLMKDPAKIKEMLEAQIQEEGLRTYLFTYAPFYDTLALSTLGEMFSLPERKVSAVVSRMISHEELGAALDRVGKVIVFRKGVELSRLQSLALTLSDKASGLIETNERTLEQRTQGTTGAFERDRGQGGRGGRGGQRNRGGGGRGGGNTRRGGSGFIGGVLGTTKA